MNRRRQKGNGGFPQSPVVIPCCTVEGCLNANGHLSFAGLLVFSPQQCPPIFVGPWLYVIALPNCNVSSSDGFYYLLVRPYLMVPTSLLAPAVSVGSYDFCWLQLYLLVLTTPYSLWFQLYPMVPTTRWLLLYLLTPTSMVWYGMLPFGVAHIATLWCTWLHQQLLKLYDMVCDHITILY